MEIYFDSGRKIADAPLKRARGMVDSDGNSINDNVFKVKAMYKKYKKSDGKEGKRFNAYQFEIGDTSKFSKYEGGGVMTQKKVPFKREFKNFKESLRNPIGKGSKTE